MSLQTWKDEFYPVPASEVPREQAVEHSLRKWRGLTQENLAKHGVDKVGSTYISDDGTKEFPAAGHPTCACCACFIDANYECDDCPLFQVRGVPCYESDEYSLDKENPYSAFIDEGNPFPMIELLEAAREYETKQRQSGDNPIEPAISHNPPQEENPQD